MKKVLSVIVLCMLAASISCGGGDAADDSGVGTTPSPSPEVGSNVLQAKRVAAGALYAAIRSVEMAGQAAFSSLVQFMNSDQLNKGQFNGNFSATYSNMFNKEDVSGTASGQYTYSLSSGMSANTLILTYDQISFGHYDVACSIENLSFNLGVNGDFSGAMEYINQLSTPITGTMSGSLEFGAVGGGDGPSFVSIDMSASNVSTTDLLVFLMGSDLNYYLGAVSFDGADATFSSTLVGDAINHEVDNLKVTVKYYLNPPINTSSDINDFAPAVNESEEYTCTSVNGTLLKSLEDGSETFTVGSDIHCTCPTCSG